MEKLTHVSAAGILHWDMLKSFWKLQELMQGWFPASQTWPCSRHLGNYELICTLVLLFSLLFCLMTQVVIIQSSITHETKPQIWQKTNECHLLSPTTIIHPALPEHQLLHIIDLKSLSSSTVEQIYISWLTLLCSLVCMEAYGFQGLELKKDGKPFPCLLLIIFPTQKCERRFGYF